MSVVEGCRSRWDGLIHGFWDRQTHERDMPERDFVFDDLNSEEGRTVGEVRETELEWILKHHETK